MNSVIPLSVRVRSTSLYRGPSEDVREFVKVVALDPDQDVIFGPYLTPAGDWVDGYGIRAMLYTIPENGVLDIHRDVVHVDRISGRGTFRADDGYYPRCLLATVPPITTAADLDRAWRAVTGDPVYMDCTVKLSEARRLRESAEKRLTARIDSLARKRRRLVEKSTNAILMCSMESPNQ